jgi:hypothetical protein
MVTIRGWSWADLDERTLQSQFRFAMPLSFHVMSDSYQLRRAKTSRAAKSPARDRAVGISIWLVLDIQIAHKLCILFNEEPARLNIIPHQALERIVREQRVLDSNLKNRPCLRIHGRGP